MRLGCEPGVISMDTVMHLPLWIHSVDSVMPFQPSVSFSILSHSALSPGSDFRAGDTGGSGY